MEKREGKQVKICVGLDLYIRLESFLRAECNANGNSSKQKYRNVILGIYKLTLVLQFAYQKLCYHSAGTTNNFVWF